MLLLFIISLLLLWIVVFRYGRRRLYQLTAAVPHPKAELPFLGITHTFLGNTEDIMSSLQKLSYDSMENNGIVRAWINHVVYFCIVNPVDTEMVLKTCLEKDDLHRFIKKLIGNGGIFAPVPIWRRRRKVIVPAFSPKVVENFVEVFSERAEKLSDTLETQSNKQFSVWPFINRYTLDSVIETTMGIKINAIGNPKSPLLNAMNNFLNLVCERIFHIWLQPDWLYKLFPGYKLHQKSIKEMQDFTDEIIQKKREELKHEKQSQTEADHHLELKSYQGRSFLDLLISLSGGDKGFNNVELREEILTLTIAGTDTSAVSVCNTLVLLGKYPKVQERLFQELYEVFGDSDRRLEKDDIPRLKYLERVVKESLRLFPPVPFIIRKVLEEIKLPSSGYTLPAGSAVAVSIWGVHRDPHYWGPDAEAFDPDRFLPERFNLKHACSFMPFSNGPRNCVGYQYALMSIKTALSAILRRYRVVGEEETSNVPHIRVKLDIMMKAVDGYQLTLERRR